MNRLRSLFSLSLLLTLAPLNAAAQDTTLPTDALQGFYDHVRPAVVVVKYQWDSELAKEEIIGCGVVVRADGLVMVPLPLVSPYLPDEQMKSFKIVVPNDANDPDEIDASFVGRDERTGVGFIQASAKADHHWTPLHFESRPPAVGQTVYGVGLLPKLAGYKPYLTQAFVSAKIRGETPQILISGGLGNTGSPVFDETGSPIGVVELQEGAQILLDVEGPRELAGVVTPPHFFVPAGFFLSSIEDPPTAGHPLRIPWIGVPEMTGVDQQLSEFLGLKNQPAVQIGDIVPGTPAAKAGLEAGNIVIAMNGHPLERGDLPEELPMILRRHLMQMHVGDKVAFTVLTEKGAPTREVTLTLEERPRSPNQAMRFYAQDLGFVAREAVFTDTYEHKMKADTEGVVIDVIRRDGAGATAKLATEDWIMQLNGQPVRNLAQFRRDYQAFRRDHARDAVVLVVHRRTGQEETINIEAPQTDAAPGGGGDLP